MALLTRILFTLSAICLVSCGGNSDNAAHTPSTALPAPEISDNQDVDNENVIDIAGQPDSDANWLAGEDAHEEDDGASHNTSNNNSGSTRDSPFDSDDNWSTEYEPPNQENPPSDNTAGDDRDLPADSDENWQAPS